VTFDEYEGLAARTINPSLNDRDRLLDAAAGLAEESGEVLGLVRKALMAGRSFSREELRVELGDALWCLAMTARAAGLSLDEVAAQNIEKLQNRHPDGFSGIGTEEKSSRN
jgi:NTP pyrophosphatase (non-canonical NTP hydrolase)